MGTPLKKLAVRQAINYGFDRAAALQIMGLGYGKAIQQVFAPYNTGWDAALDNAYPYNVEKAKQLLADAGYPNGFTLNMPTNPALGAYVYDFMKDQFAKMGITINYTATTGSADFFAQVWAAKWPLYRMALQRDPNSWSLVQFLYARDAAWNPSGFGDATTDALIAKIRVSTGKTQAALLKQLNTYTVQQAWFCPLYAPPVFFAHNNSVKVTTHAGNSMPFLSDFKK
jgi:peptide/nickel transport system substrate-binding protein